MPTDAELIHRCGERDAAAMRELIHRYEARLRRFLARLLGPGEDAEDTLCDVFVRLWRSAPGYRGDCAASRWIYRAAVTAATDVLRARRKTRRERLLTGDDDLLPAAPAGEPEHQLLRREKDERCRRLVREAVDLLPAQQRMAVTLHYLEGFSYADVAALTGVPLTTVRMRLFGARRRMHAHLRDRLEADELPEGASAAPRSQPCTQGSGCHAG